MKIKNITLLTLTAVALSGCSAIQAVANAADGALGAVNNGSTAWTLRSAANHTAAAAALAKAKPFGF